jgi:protein-export membrane protein SecD
MSKKSLTVALIIFVVAVGAVWATIAALRWQPQLGLDLRGGVTTTLVPEAGQGEIDQERLDQTVAVIRQRVDALGVAEPDIARQGDTIQVQLPGVTDQERAEEVIGRTAQLQFRRVLEVITPDAPTYNEVGGNCDQNLEGPPPADEEVVLCGQLPDVPDDAPEGEEPAVTKYRLGTVDVSGEDVEDATAQIDDSGLSWFVSLNLSRQGDRAFQQLTGELACEAVGDPTRRLAIVLDGIVESAPEVNADVQCGQGITGGGIITVGGEDEARDLAVVLRTGALPIQLEFATSQSVSPTLGHESLVAGLQAGLFGLVLVALYMIAMYRGLGALAVLELAMFGVLVYGLIIVLGNTVGFTLTLAGIAGIIVSVGIAADSSIIYRERYRDERRAGRTVRSAAEHAFRKAFRTNLTGNTVSFLAAVVLWMLAVGPVRGFAFTLGLSTLIDTLLFATFTRSTFSLVARSPRLANSRWVGLRTATSAAQEGPSRPRQKVRSR